MSKKLPDYKIVSLSSLIPYARNSRTHSPEQVAQIASSMKEFGFTNPVLIDEQGGIKRWQDFTGKQATHEETGKTYAELANG